MPEAVQAFKEWLVAEYRPDASWESIQVLEGTEAPEGGLSIRLHVGKKTYYEVRLPESAESLQVGLSTESRVVNEELEETVLDNGGDLDDLLADELCDLGDEPQHMEHFFERPAFRYTVRLTLASTDELESPVLRARVKTLLKACHILFQGCVDEA